MKSVFCRLISGVLVLFARRATINCILMAVEVVGTRGGLIGARIFLQILHAKAKYLHTTTVVFLVFFILQGRGQWFIKRIGSNLDFSKRKAAVVLN